VNPLNRVTLSALVQTPTMPASEKVVSSTANNGLPLKTTLKRGPANSTGIALARTTLAATDLISGRLLRPFTEELRLSKTYWIICPNATASLPKIVTFRDWLVAEAANDVRQLKKLSTRPKG